MYICMYICIYIYIFISLFSFRILTVHHHPSCARENGRLKFPGYKYQFGKSFPPFSPERILFALRRKVESICALWSESGRPPSEYRFANTADTGKQFGIYRGFFKLRIVEKKGGRVPTAQGLNGRSYRDLIDFFSRFDISFFFLSFLFFSNRFEKN